MGTVAPASLKRGAKSQNAGASACWLVPLLWLTACVTPLEAPSAFDDQQYLCGPDNAAVMETRMAQCIETHAKCQGLISFRGVVGSQPVKVGSLITGVTIIDLARRDKTTSRAVFIQGRAPYFDFSYDMPEFDGPPGHTPSGLYAPNPATCIVPFSGVGCDKWLLNLEVRGGTYLGPLDSVMRDIQIETADELRVGFSGNLTRGGNVEGCFDLLISPS